MRYRAARETLSAHLSRLGEEAAFRDAAIEWNRLREEISAFREPCSHVVEFTDLSAKHTKAENAMRAAYRALEAPSSCPSCGTHDPKDDVLDEVDIGVGVQYNRCPDPFHRDCTE